MELKEIVPEYHSKNVFVRNLFLKRLEIALRLAEARLKSRDDLRVVDLGCGEGNFLKLLEENFRNIKTFGIDIEPEILKTRKFLRAELRIANIRDSGFPDNFFDIVFCLDTLEHFENLEDSVREIKRIMKPNTLLIVSLPTENLFYKLGRLVVKGTISSQKGPCSSPHFHNAKIILKFLSYRGFKIIEEKSLPPLLRLFELVSLKNIKK